MSGHSVVARSILSWGQALHSAEAGCAAALAPASRRAALAIENALTLDEKARRILAEAVESSLRLAAERQASAVFAVRLDARAKFQHLLERIEGMRAAPSAAPRATPASGGQGEASVVPRSRPQRLDLLTRGDNAAVRQALGGGGAMRHAPF